MAAPDAPSAIAVSHSFVEIDRPLRRYYRVCREVESPLMPSGMQPSRTVIWKRWPIDALHMHAGLPRRN